MRPCSNGAKLELGRRDKIIVMSVLFKKYKLYLFVREEKAAEKC